MQPFLRLVKRSACAFLSFLLAASVLTQAQTSSSKTASSSHNAAAPADLPLVDLDGYNRILAKYRGKPLLVTFWATWCEPCRFEFPMVVELAKQYSPQGLAVAGVSLDNDADIHLVRRFLAKNHPGFPSYRQKPGIDVDAFYRGVNPEWTGSMPETLFYGRDGHIVAHFVGAHSREAFEQGIHMILAGSPSSAGSR